MTNEKPKSPQEQLKTLLDGIKEGVGFARALEAVKAAGVATEVGTKLAARLAYTEACSIAAMQAMLSRSSTISDQTLVDRSWDLALLMGERREQTMETMTPDDTTE